ncbi:glycosyltransferase [Alphaproteobacteria bacterium]|nr:glycosyltransferase [Alphaproteobacteria bacterium]
MKFTVVTPVKNCGDEIFKTISSVRAQVNVDVEHLIIDGGQINPSLWNRVDPSKNLRIVSSEDTGIYDAFNKGVSLANGGVIGFLGSGDRFADQTSLEALKNTFLETGSDAVYGDLAFVAMGQQNMIVRNWVSGEYSRLKLLFGWMPPHPSLYVRKDVFNEVGYFDDRLSISGDYDFIVRLFNKTTIRTSYVRKRIVLMVTGGISNRLGRNLLYKFMEDRKIAKNQHLLGFITVMSKISRKSHQFF